MRALICLCLASGLLAGEPPLPGRDGAFLTTILAPAEGAPKPWKTFRLPEASASAVVEVFGELTREELRQVAFQEFIAWFREDLRRFWRSQGAAVPASSLASATLPVERFGGNPVSQNVPLAQVDF